MPNKVLVPGEKDLYKTGSYWDKSWDPSSVSIDDDSVRLLVKALQLLNEGTDNKRIVKNGPLKGIKLDDLRFVQIYIPPSEANATFQIRFAIGLDADEQNEDGYVQVFGREFVCKAPDMRAPGVVHKILKRNLNLPERTSVLGTSFTLDDEGGIKSLNRSGQNEGFIEVNNFLGLSCFLIDEKYTLDDQIPIKIAKKFTEEDILTASKGECILLQQLNDEYYVHYKGLNRLERIQIVDGTIINILRKITFPEGRGEELTRIFLNQNSALQEKTEFEPIRKHIERVTKLYASPIPSFDTQMFLTEGRNLSKNLFIPLHVNSIKCINEHLQHHQLRLKDETDLDAIRSFKNEIEWEKITQIENEADRNALIGLLLTKSLLFIATIDLNLRGERYKDYPKKFNEILDYLSAISNIYTDKAPDNLSKHLVTRKQDLNITSSAQVNVNDDELSVPISRFPIWLTAYITAVRNNNESLSEHLRNNLLAAYEANKSDIAANQQIADMLQDGLAHAKKIFNEKLFKSLKAIANKFDQETYKFDKSVLEYFSPKKVSISELSEKISLDLINLNETHIANQDFHSLYAKGWRDFSGAIFVDVDLNEYDNLAAVNFTNADLRTTKNIEKLAPTKSNLKGAKLTAEQVICLYEQRQDLELRDVTLIDTSLTVEQLGRAYKLGHRNFEGVYFEGSKLCATDSLKDANFNGVYLVQIHFKNVDLENISLDSAVLTRARFENTNLSGIDFSKCGGLPSVEFEGVRLSSEQLRVVTNAGCNSFKNIDFTQINIEGSTLHREKDFGYFNSNFDDEEFNSNDDEVNLKGSTLTGEQVIYLYKQGRRDFKEINIKDFPLDYKFDGGDFTGATGVHFIGDTVAAQQEEKSAQQSPSTNRFSFFPSVDKSNGKEIKINIDYNDIRETILLSVQDSCDFNTFQNLVYQNLKGRLPNEELATFKQQCIFLDQDKCNVENDENLEDALDDTNLTFYAYDIDAWKMYRTVTGL